VAHLPDKGTCNCCPHAKHYHRKAVELGNLLAILNMATGQPRTILNMATGQPRTILNMANVQPLTKNNLIWNLELTQEIVEMRDALLEVCNAIVLRGELILSLSPKDTKLIPDKIILRKGLNISHVKNRMWLTSSYVKNR